MAANGTAIEPENTVASNAPGILEELILVGTGTSGQVPNVHCLTRKPDVLCRVCFEACCYSIIDEETGETIATGSTVPGMSGAEISALLVGNNYFRAILEKEPAVQDPTADLTHPINGLILMSNDVFPERVPPASADDQPAQKPLEDYPDTAKQPTVSAPHRRHLLKWNPNRRRNTCAALRFRDPSQPSELKTAIIDAGKSFYEAALDHFPRHGMRTIDALILTHGHADACFGLDDLRQWTIGPEGYRTQNAIDVYLNEETMGVVGGAYPYLVDKKMATGGGDVTSLR
jgi:hypothetical protein